MTEYHASLSPSGAVRWMSCPGSVVLEEPYSDEDSVFAAEGTAAHIIAARCLTHHTSAREYLGETLKVSKRWTFVVDTPMAAFVDDYCKLVRELAEGKTLLVEQRVPIGHITGEADAGGTSDAIIIDAKRKHITVVDLKYGVGNPVSAQENPQLQLYALGAIRLCETLAEFDHATMVIHQPRLNAVSQWEDVPVSDLERFAEQVSAAGDTTRSAQAKHADPGVDTTAWQDAYLRPGESACKWCKAKAGCPALTDLVVETTGSATAADFAEFTPEKPNKDTGNNFLSMAMSKVGLVETWCKAIRAEAERRLVAGEKLDGWKLVEGKLGNRVWNSEPEAEEALKKLRLKTDEIWERKLVTPTSLEKLLKKDKPKVWEKMQEHIVRAAGKTSVAPSTDPRPALVPATATAEDFGEFVKTGEPES
jgi:hypothetical protein